MDTHLVYQSKYLKIAKAYKFNPQISSDSTNENVITIEIVNLESKFFYGLVHYVKTYNQFKNAIFKLFTDLFYSLNDLQINDQYYCKKEDSKLVIDFDYLKNSLNSNVTKTLNKEKYFNELYLCGVISREKCEIIRTW